MKHYPIHLAKSKFSLPKFISYFEMMQESELNFESDLIFRKTLYRAIEYATNNQFVPREVELAKTFTILLLVTLVAYIIISIGASIFGCMDVESDQCVKCVMATFGVLSLGWAAITLVLLYSWKRMT